VPLKDAYTQVLACVASPELAEHDLYRDLLDGRVKSAFRHISRDGNEEWRLLKPSDWRQWTLQGYMVPGGYSVEVRLIEEGKAVAGYFFIRRADLDKHYPTATPATTAVHRLDETRPPERRRGPVPTYEWHVIDGEIALRCINSKTRLLEIPKSERRLAQDMLDWCQEKYGKEPAESEIREAVKAVCAALRKAYK
jgi:hypothetical protein